MFVVAGLLEITFARHDLRSLHGAHLGDPMGTWLNLADDSQLIARISRDADVVGSLQDKLDIPYLEHFGASLFSIPARSMQDVVDK